MSLERDFNKQVELVNLRLRATAPILSGREDIVKLLRDVFERLREDDHVFGGLAWRVMDMIEKLEKTP